MDIENYVVKTDVELFHFHCTAAFEFKKSWTFVLILVWENIIKASLYLTPCI